MKIHNAQYKIDDSSILNYYEVGTEKNKLLLLHAQGTNSCSFYSVVTKLAKHYHVYLVDYYGHGKSSHNPEKYNLVSIGNDIMDFIENVIFDSVAVLGHSSGGLIAAYIAAHSPRCSKLILEDPPFFSSWGERRYNRNKNARKYWVFQPKCRYSVGINRDIYTFITSFDCRKQPLFR